MPRKSRATPDITPVPRELTDEAVHDIVAAAVQWARRDEALIAEMREALTADDHDRLVQAARALCGIERRAGMPEEDQRTP